MFCFPNKSSAGRLHVSDGSNSSIKCFHVNSRGAFASREAGYSLCRKDGFSIFVRLTADSLKWSESCILFLTNAYISPPTILLPFAVDVASCIERMLLMPSFREPFWCWEKRHGITFSLPPLCLPCLMAIWCLLGVTWCLVMKPMSFQGEEILSKPLNVPRALIGRRCHRRWEAVGVTQQRESIT